MNENNCNVGTIDSSQMKQAGGSGFSPNAPYFHLKDAVRRLVKKYEACQSAALKQADMYANRAGILRELEAELNKGL